MPATFGKITKGGTPDYVSANGLMGIKFTSGGAGTLESISLYILDHADSDKVKCAVYDASLGLLSNGTTEEKTVTDSYDDWMTFNFDTAPVITASTIYWLCWWVNQRIDVYYDAGTTDQMLIDSLSYDTWPDPVVPDSYPDLEFSIYATYAPLQINVHDCTDLVDKVIGG